jgi:hypothetical protein
MWNLGDVYMKFHLLVLFSYTFKMLITENKNKGVGHGSCGRAPAYLGQDTEFKPQYHHPPKKR